VELEGPPGSELRADRLYSRGLRLLETPARDHLAGEGVSQRDRLGAALSVCGSWRCLRRSSRRHIGIVATSLLAGIGLFLAIEPLRSAALLRENIALGQPWRSSSAEPGFPAQGRISDDLPPIFMHTKEEETPWVVIELQGGRAIGRVEITNRDDCCAERAVPLVVESSMDGVTWSPITRRVGPFSVWRAPIPTQVARFVRIRLDRRGVLHLRRVRLFA
jgi:hypothetical protein